MKPSDRPGPLDTAIVILSPVIVAGLTVVFLVGFWCEAGWRWVRGDLK
ncbi:MAG: hypothetical protein WC749_01875 [Dehalococcoidia bacterium]